VAKNQKKTIWILSELYYPEVEGSGYYITKISEALALRYRVRVLSVQPTYDARGTKAPADEVHNHVRIHRCRSTTLNKNILFFRLVNLFTISVSIFFNALFRIHQDDIVLVITNPPSLPFIADITSRLRGAKVILRVEDLYPEVLVAAGLLNAESLPVKILNAIHRRLYQRVDRIIVLGRDMLARVKNKIGDGRTHVALIPHWADSDQITPMPRENNALLHRLGLLDKFVIQYSGNMGRTHDLEGLIRCAKILETQSNIHFLFIGSGAKEPTLRKIVGELKPKNVTLLPPQPRADLALSLNACDLAVISFVRGMSGVSVPSRMYNIMSAGKPILAVADENSELAQMIAEENIGWVVKPESSPVLIASAIMEAIANRDLLNQMSGRARLAAVEKYACPMIIRKHEELIDHLTLSDPSFRRDLS
jgi:colanic acid biosynthesis glycosyl transferase WcaI